ncbi:MAG: PRD domain-containing protein [Erysipelotrichaceae bacterium]|nr:PRD domain-containing protein [Erysipelotrichaceae bacterium]MDY5252773.1 PRD domain-containing protein [Erysipelotrichaceae bacterium]
MLTDRQNKLLQLLKNSDKWITGKELADILNVSDRTIRSDIENINNYYSSNVIISNRHKGYNFNNGALLNNVETDQKNNIPQNAQERVIYILHELLFSNRSLNLYDIRRDIFVSEYTLENDIKKIREIISKYSDIRLVRSKNHISLEGSESEKRVLYKKLLEEETNGNFLNMDALAALYKDFDLLKIKEIFESTLKDYDYNIRNISMPMLMMHIGICLVRLLQNNYVQTDLNKQYLENSVEYKISYDFFSRVSKILSIKVVESETLRLSVLLMSKKNNFVNNDEITINNDRYQISAIVNNLLEKILDRFNVDMRYDKELRIGLELHIIGLLERQKYNAMIQNVYLQQIKIKYPLIFEMAVWAAKLLNEYTNLPVTEDEIGFIAMHLGSAYERSSSINKQKVLIIYPKDQVLSNMCDNRILSRFEERITIVGHLNTFEEKKVLDYNPDLIITTLPLQHNLNIPTVQISLFFNTEDESNIFYTLNDIEKKKNHLEFECFIKDIIYPDLFHIDLDLESPEKVINYMCDKMYEKGLIPDNFKESVLHRETLSSTSMVYGLAIPHAFNVVAIHSCISVGILKKPIKWGAFNVSIVIILGIRENDQKLMKIFFEWLSNVVSDTASFSELLEIQSYKEFIRFVENH